MIKVIVVIPDANIGTRLCEYLNEKYGVTATLYRDIQGIGEAQADAYIIYRKCVDDLRALEVIDGKIALLYGKSPIPPADKFLTFPKLVGNLPECVDGFLETLLDHNILGDLSWAESESESRSRNRNDFASDRHSNTWSPVRSVALFSPGGGVGKTTTAVHLAKLAEQSRINVGLIETDEDKGGVLRYMGRPPAHEGLDSLEKTVWDDEDFFKESIERLVQKVGRIQVVPMVSTFAGLACTVKNVSSLFHWADSQFALTLYDLPPRLRDVMTFSVLQEVDQVILVAEPTDVLMDALQKHMQLCQGVEQFHNLPSKYRLLVNKVPEKNGLRPEEMAEALGLPLLGAIPADIEHYDRIINHAKFEIPADSPWRTVFSNLDLGGDSVLATANEGNTYEPRFSTPRKENKNKKKHKGLFSFFFA